MPTGAGMPLASSAWRCTMKATHERATSPRPLRGRQRFFLVVAGVVGASVAVAVLLVIAVVRW